jgi:uncharacterized spore protein YtfJ
MQVEDILDQAREALTVRRVFGEPIERDGVTIIPVANVMGGGGGGWGEGPWPPPGATEATATTNPLGAEAAATADDPRIGSSGSGSGVGFGVRATPAGAYVIKDGAVRWEPAMDLTRVAIMGQVVVIVFLLVVRSVLKAHAKG